jgi:outer membrane protein assembly factor BamB
MSVERLVFIGFNSRVAALDRDTGDVVWQWVCPKPKSGGYITMLFDVDRLIVAVNGYMYCLDPRTGTQYWYNEMKGFGTGVTSIVTCRSQSSLDVNAGTAHAIAAQRAAAAAAGASAAGS